MAAHSDEILAQKLQAQFDEEYTAQQETIKKDAAMARAVAKAHTMSDSDDSDSQETVARPRTGSEDLFLDSDEDRGSSSKKNRKCKRDFTKRSDKKYTKSNSPKDQAKGDPYDVDTDVESKSSDDEKSKNKTAQKPCKYGNKCFRKNPSHIDEYYHPPKRKTVDDSSSSPSAKKAKMPSKSLRQDKTSADVVEEFQPFSLFLTKVKDIPSNHNTTGALSLRDILSESMGSLKASCHFNFMFDMPWIVKQYPESARKLPVLLVHGEQNRDELRMKSEAADFPQISLCRAPLEIPYGTHHTKMMLLLYKTGLRVVIHTANLIPNDWHQKTQGIWVSQVFPPLTNPEEKGDSPTGFKTDLLQYLSAYRSHKLAPWERHIQAHDMRSANVHIIGSVPGRHTLSQKNCWGHLKLKKVLSERGPDSARVQNWPLLGQFSSIGSLGPDKDAWLMSEWAQSLAACKGPTMFMAGSSKVQQKLNLIFPSLNNIRLSLEGYNGGGCVPYSIRTASKQPWLTPLFSQWLSEGRGRSRAVPHIKSYARHSPDGSEAAWFIVTSANLSKAAWGTLEKKGSQLMIRSYELGVLFLPQYFGYKNSFPVSSKADEIVETDKAILPLPYDLPPKTYDRGDRPWFIDVPSVDQPDTFGTMWCPPL